MPNTQYTFTPGEKCFAKVKGFPHWPARINSLPPDVKVPRGKFPIFFYGTHEVCFLPGNAIFSFEKYRNKFGNSRKSDGFNKGMEELEKNGTLLQYGEDPKAVQYLSQFYKFSVTKARNNLRKLKVNKQSTGNSEGCSEHETDSKSSGGAAVAAIENQINIKNENNSNNNGIVELASTVMDTSGESVAMIPENVVKNVTEETSELINNQMEISEKETKKEMTIEEDNSDSKTFNDIPKDESLLNETLSTICMADLSSDDQLEDEIDRRLDEEKPNSDCYMNDFSNLLFEIRKYAWSSSRKLDYQKRVKRPKYDSRVRIFFPWYHCPK